MDEEKNTAATYYTLENGQIDIFRAVYILSPPYCVFPLPLQLYASCDVNMLPRMHHCATYRAKFLYKSNHMGIASCASLSIYAITGVHMVQFSVGLNGLVCPHSAGLSCSWCLGAFRASYVLYRDIMGVLREIFHNVLGSLAVCGVEGTFTLLGVGGGIVCLMVLHIVLQRVR